MPNFLKTGQYIVSSQEVEELGTEKTKDATGKMLAEFFKEIMEILSSGEKKEYLIQWAVSEVGE